MAKFQEGDKCKVIKNLLAPQSVGHIVKIKGIAVCSGNNPLYKIDIDGMDGYAEERCLEKI